MRLGIPKETVPDEHRVALVPETVGRLGDGTQVIVETGAGEAAGSTARTSEGSKKTTRGAKKAAAAGA